MSTSPLKSVAQIFDTKLLRIPDYQRGFSWTKEQLNDFWGDLTLLQPDQSHYMGVLTLEPVSDNIYKKWDEDKWSIEGLHYSPFYIVDGQQRLLTIVILLFTILKKLDQNQNQALNEEDELFFSSKLKNIEKYIRIRGFCII